MTLETKTFFPYSWDLDSENEEKTIIRIYGLDENNKNVAVKIPNYTPFVYLELPDNIKWDVNKAQDLVDALSEKLSEEHQPQMNKLMYKKRLYGADMLNGKRMNFPFLFLSFISKKAITELSVKMSWPFFVKNMGKIKVKVHEDNVNPILQMICLRKLSYTDWITFEGKVPRVRETTCDFEYIASWKKLELVTGRLDIPRPLIMSFDIEVNSSIVGSMPQAKLPADKVFMISCIFLRQGSSVETWEEYLIHIGDVDKGYISPKAKLISCESEAEVLSSYSKLMREKNPNIVMGYNIFKFDIDYMIKRSKMTGSVMDFMNQGFNKKRMGKEISIKWSSSAFKNQSFLFIQSDGRLFVDLFPIIQREYTFANYRLKTVSSFFLGETKDPLTPQGIFKCYRISMEGWRSDDNAKRLRGKKAMNIIGKYCVQDALLPPKVFEKIYGWIGLVEMSKVCNTDIFTLFTQGQQIKVYSQVYKNCLKDNYVVQRNVYAEESDETYTGAYVFLPKPGVYDDVIPEDFKSMYPNIMRARNICPSTWVKEGSNIPLDKCDVIEWVDHQNCIHDTVKRTGKKKKKVICNKHRKYMFLKEPIGVLPKLLGDLLDARDNVKLQIKEAYKKLREAKTDEEKRDIERLLIVLDKRQLALKILANSVYGGIGVQAKKGLLPFMIGAMCVCAVGREYIQKVAQLIKENHKGEIVYGDSVTGDTPLILRDIYGMVTIREIMDLANIWEPYPLFKPNDNSLKDKEQNISVPYEVWTANGWAKIRRVIRHKTNKKIYRVTTHTGSVDVTEDHSLISIDGNEVKPNEVKLGDKLLHNFPYIFNDRRYCITKHEAYIDGFNTAIDKTNISTLILNSIEHVKKYFFMGYTFGYKRGNLSNVDNYKMFDDGKIEFYIKDKVMGQSLYYLVRSLRYKVSITPNKNVEYDNYHQFIITVYDRKRNDIDFIINWVDIRKNIIDIEDITEYGENNISNEITVYDIETKDGTFGAGVGELVVRNTDSNYVRFPWITDKAELWDYAIKVAKEVSSHFPKPMELAFEEVIYSRFLILSKKRYMSLGCKRDGVVSDEIQKKGVLLKRRDNSKFARDIYSHVVMSIFHKEPKEKILNELVEGILKVYTSPINYKDFIITKSVKEINEYKIKPLSDDPKKREKRLNDLKCNEEDYPVKALPSQAQLMLKMKRRGENVGAGTRLEYVIVDVHDLKARVFEKIEDYSYFIRYSTVLSLDLLYYIKNLINPIDELLSILNEKNFLKNFYKMVKCRYECNLKIKNYTTCKTYIENEEDTDEE